MVRNKSLYFQARELRIKGKSYNQINALLNIPKSTLSEWFSHKYWSQNVKDNLIEIYKIKSKSTIKIAHNTWIKKIQIRHLSYIHNARLEFKRLYKDLLFIAGICIYWGEGSKSNKSVVSVANTDPNLLQIVANFYRKCLTVQNSKLRIGLFLYRDINKTYAKKFWSNKLGIPISQFIKTQILTSRSKLTKRRSKYGICSLYFSSTELSIKIQEWIRLLGLEMRE